MVLVSQIPCAHNSGAKGFSICSADACERLLASQEPKQALGHSQAAALCLGFIYGYHLQGWCMVFTPQTVLSIPYTDWS